jgi:hypothetical protein
VAINVFTLPGFCKTFALGDIFNLESTTTRRGLRPRTCRDIGRHKYGNYG